MEPSRFFLISDFENKYHPDAALIIDAYNLGGAYDEKGSNSH